MKKLSTFSTALLLATAVSAQNVGIGTTNPQATLDISGDSGEKELVSLYKGAPVSKVIWQEVTGSGPNDQVPAWQSFTATGSGILHSIELNQSYTSYSGPFSVTVSIYKGEGTGGDLLGQVTMDVIASSQGNWTQTPFLNIPIMEGEKYTIGSSNRYGWSYSVGNPYQGGKGDGMENRDYGFRVNMGGVEKEYLRITGDDAPSALNVNADITSRANILSQGRIGIGTDNPRAPLHVKGESDEMSSDEIRYFRYSHDLNTLSSGWTGRTAGLFEGNVVATTSFIAASNVTFSDERIKKIQGVSDGPRDLATLNELEVTDYTMIDSLNHPGAYKKVIAQQVEQHLPEAVSRYSDYIPSVYAVAGTVACDATLSQTVIGMAAAHRLIPGDQVKLITEKQGEQLLTVASVSDAQTFTVEADGRNWGDVFVYGKKVDDFRVVDYDAIAMLNVSATQELFRLLTEAKGQLQTQDQRIRTLEQQNQKLEQHHSDLRADIDAMKALLTPEKIAGKEE